MSKNFLSCLFIISLFFFLSPLTFAQKKPRKVEIKKAEIKAPAYGQLTVYSAPEGAEIYINNRLQGKILADGNLSKPITLKPGKYQLRIEHREYFPFNQEIKLASEKLLPIEAKLEAKFGLLELKFAKFSPETVIKIDNKIVDKDLFTLSPDNLLLAKLPVGKYNLTIELAEHKTFSSPIEISGQALQIPVVLEKVPAKLKITAKPNTRVYLNKEQIGIVSSLGVLEATSFLRNGKYLLLLENNGFEAYQTIIDLEADKETTLTVDLKPRLTSAEFADNFEGGLSLWNAPDLWKAENGVMTVQGINKIGMPKDLYYCESEVVFGLRLLDSRGAAWIINAQDEKNYYLFYLNGPTGQAPNKFQVFLCRDGVLNLNSPIAPSLPIIPPIKVGDSYRVYIRLKNGTIEHEILSGATAEKVSLGFFKDPKNNFLCGNVGFASPSGEKFQVHGFVITPSVKTDSAKQIE